MKILIVEDEALVAFAIEAALTEAGHHVVGIARDGRLALSLADTQQPQLAIVDLILARGSRGDVLARRLRVLGIPSMFVSGHPDRCKEHADVGVLACLSKPFLNDEVTAAVAVVEKLIKGEVPKALPKNLELYGAAQRSMSN